MLGVAAGSRAGCGEWFSMTGGASFGCVTPDRSSYGTGAVDIAMAGSSRTGTGVGAGCMFGGYRVAVGYGYIAVKVTGGRLGDLGCTGGVAVSTGGIIVFCMAACVRAGCVNSNSVAGITTC